MAEALLALGSNLGDRKGLVDDAVARLAGLPGSPLTARSSYYRTDPVGPVTQSWFLNIAVALRTELDPDALLAACHAIEAALGRNRSAEIRWGPRFIDIDIIAFDNESRSDPGLTLPHPRFAERAFVLVPLAEIASGVLIAGRTVADHLAALERTGVERLDWPIPAAIDGAGESSAKPMADRDRMNSLEAEAEAAYSKMYDVANPTMASGHYSEAKEALYDAIAIARNLGDAGALRRLASRLEHIKAVFRSQFS